MTLLEGGCVPRKPLEAGKSKEVDSSLDSPEGTKAR